MNFGRRAPAPQTWVCFDPGDGKPLFVTDRDLSSPLVACYPLNEVVGLTRLAYYAKKLVDILSKARIPVP